MDLNLPPTVTDRAFARLAEIDAAPQALRIAVEGGGCSGFQYEIKLDEPADDDLVLEGDGQRVVVDQVSLPFLANLLVNILPITTIRHNPPLAFCRPDFAIKIFKIKGGGYSRKSRNFQDFPKNHQKPIFPAAFGRRNLQFSLVL